MKTAGPTEASKTPAGGPGSNRSRSTSPTPSSIARTNRWAGVARVGVLAASDFSALIVAGVAAFELWASRAHGQPAALYLPAAPAAILIVLAYGQGRLYPGFGLGPVEVLRRYWLITGVSFLGLAALVLLLKLDNIYSRMTLAIALGLSLLLVPLFRWLTVRIGRRQQWWPEPVLLLGQAKQGQRVRRLLDELPAGEVRPVGVVTVDPARGEAAVEESKAFADAGIRLVFAEVDGPDTAAMLDRLRLIFPRVIVVRRMQDLPVEGVQVRNLDGLLGLEYGNNLLRRQSRWVKRGMDIDLSLLARWWLSPPIVSGLWPHREVAESGPCPLFPGARGAEGEDDPGSEDSDDGRRSRTGHCAASR